MEIRMKLTDKDYDKAIKWAEERAATPLAANTVKAYWTRYHHLNKIEVLAGLAEHPKTRGYDRAASRYCMAHEILKAHKVQDLARVDAIWADVMEMEDQAKKNKELYEAGEWPSKKHYKNSKKDSIKPLPADWRVNVCNQMTNHKHNVAVRILACTGCRPYEVVTGIQVYRNKKGINFKIIGAKFKGNDERGQEWRILTVPSDHPIGSTIRDGHYQASSAQSLTKAITRKAEKLGYEGVSAYSFRHQMASDMKFSGYSEVDIANALGHIATVTQERYGNSGAGGSVKLKVKSSATPRVNKKKKRLKKNMRPK